MAGTTPVWTQVLTSSSLTLPANSNIQAIAILWLSGTVNVTGDSSLSVGGVSMPSQPVSVTQTNPSVVIGGVGSQLGQLFLDCSSGSAQILAYF